LWYFCLSRLSAIEAGTQDFMVNINAVQQNSRKTASIIS
jgi:hypothetical protein